MQNVEGYKISRKLPFVPTKEQVAMMMNTCAVNTFKGLRDRAVLELMYSSGLRADEVVELEYSDYRSGCVHIRKAKGDKDRVAPVTEEAQRWINLYIEMYRGKEPGGLFISPRGGVISRQTVWNAAKEVGDLCGLTKVTAHTFRHACATHLLAEGANIKVISKLLGHASVTSTEIYAQVYDNQVHEMIHNIHPRRR